MKYKLQIQRAEIAEGIRARFAMAIPIIHGMLYATKADMVKALGGVEKITLEQFARIYVESPGDYGICFEYAVHQAIKNRDKAIHPLLSNVLDDLCGIKGDAESILFGAEKTGQPSIIQTAKNLLTADSRILVGKVGQPPLLKKYLDDAVKAFRSERHREKLPQSIRGLWKADLFIGSGGPDRWVGTTLKTNRRDLEAAPGLRIGMFPEERPGQKPEVDEMKNLVLCPLPYSGDFMQLFGATFQIIKQITAAKGKMPSRIALVYEHDQEVAKWLTDRSGFPVAGILEALDPIKQPDLLEEKDAPETRAVEGTEAAAPIPLQTK